MMGKLLQCTSNWVDKDIRNEPGYNGTYIIECSDRRYFDLKETGSGKVLSRLFDEDVLNNFRVVLDYDDVTEIEDCNIPPNTPIFKVKDKPYDVNNPDKSRYSWYASKLSIPELLIKHEYHIYELERQIKVISGQITGLKSHHPCC